MREFDDELRRHTAFEEEEMFPPAAAGKLPGGKLSAPADESASDRLFRELRIEHVQIRELSGIMVRHLAPGGDPRAAHALAASLARRWDAHTEREEREAYPFARRKARPPTS
jgi:hemerythrin HHE cation binding domain-containing protein